MNPDDDGRPMTPALWDALTRTTRPSGAILVRTPRSTGISHRTATALTNRGLITITNGRAHPTPAGQAAINYWHHRHARETRP